MPDDCGTAGAGADTAGACFAGGEGDREDADDGDGERAALDLVLLPLRGLSSSSSGAHMLIVVSLRSTAEE